MNRASLANVPAIRARSINHRHVNAKVEIYQSPACIYKSDSLANVRLIDIGGLSVPATSCAKILT